MRLPPLIDVVHRATQTITERLTSGCAANEGDPVTCFLQATEPGTRRGVPSFPNGGFVDAAGQCRADCWPRVVKPIPSKPSAINASAVGSGVWKGGSKVPNGCSHAVSPPPLM